jgi:hypothetical protein
MAVSNRESRVYFVQAEGGGFIKIGHAVNLAQRLATMQLGCPLRLQILVNVPGGVRREKELHVRFKAYRRHGEWFEPADELLAFIEEMRAELSAEEVARREAAHVRREAYYAEMAKDPEFGHMVAAMRVLDDPDPLAH